MPTLVWVCGPAHPAGRIDGKLSRHFLDSQWWMLQTVLRSLETVGAAGARFEATS